MIETQLHPGQAMASCLAQWRDSIAGCDDAGLRDQVRELESVSRMLHSVMLTAVAELDSRNVAVNTGFRSTKRLLAGMLHLSATEAGTRVTHATALAPHRTLGGEILPPALPNTAAALAAGEIGPAQVRVIAETMNAIPASVSSIDHETAEADLARYARSFDPASLHRSGGTSWRTSIKTVQNLATSPNPLRPLESSGSGNAATAGWGSKASWIQSTAPRSAP